MSRCGDDDDDDTLAFSLPSNQDQVAADETFMSVGTDLLCSGSTSMSPSKLSFPFRQSPNMKARATRRRSVFPTVQIKAAFSCCLIHTGSLSRLTPGNSREPLRQSSHT